MLEVSQLSRSYGSVLAVDAVSFTINRGEIVGLLGHNGAGKTTIMKMLSGYLEPDAGSIRVAGRELAGQTKAAQRELGYLPENLPIYPDLLVADYLDYAAELRGFAGEERTQALRRAVAATDLGATLLTPIANLSRGFRQRVGVAQAILGHPTLLIFDEPTNGLDPTQTEHMRELIRELAQNATVILSTHIMQEVDALCDRVLILSAGRLVVDARLEELRRSRHALLATSLEPPRASAVLAPFAAIESYSPQDAGADGFHYRLRLGEGMAQHDACAGVSRAVQDAGARLYELRRERRDLETLFREVSRAPLSTLSEAPHSDAHATNAHTGDAQHPVEAAHG